MAGYIVAHLIVVSNISSNYFINTSVNTSKAINIW